MAQWDRQYQFKFLANFDEPSPRRCRVLHYTAEAVCCAYEERSRYGAKDVHPELLYSFHYSATSGNPNARGVSATEKGSVTGTQPNAS